MHKPGDVVFLKRYGTRIAFVVVELRFTRPTLDGKQVYKLDFRESPTADGRGFLIWEDDIMVV